MPAPVGVGMSKITQYDMASMIGTVREIVSRALKDLELSGAIKIQNNKIVILDRDKLFELSK
jgi:CRP-like cAMP-binding protein